MPAVPAATPAPNSSPVPSSGAVPALAERVGQADGPPVRPVPDSRPQAQTWRRTLPVRTGPDQPALELGNPGERSVAAAGRLVAARSAAAAGVHIVRTQAPWTAFPDPGLPDAAAWSARLALAVAQALLGQRPATQLVRWVAADVLDGLGLRQRRRPADDVGRSAVAVVVRSVHCQQPAPSVAEAAAHLCVGRTTLAMAFRLEAVGDRWLCVALEVGRNHTTSDDWIE